MTKRVTSGQGHVLKFLVFYSAWRAKLFLLQSTTNVTESGVFRSS